MNLSHVNKKPVCRLLGRGICVSFVYIPKLAGQINHTTSLRSFCKEWRHGVYSKKQHEGKTKSVLGAQRE